MVAIVFSTYSLARRQAINPLGGQSFKPTQASSNGPPGFIGGPHQSWTGQIDGGQLAVATIDCAPMAQALLHNNHGPERKDGERKPTAAGLKMGSSGCLIGASAALAGQDGAPI